MTYRDRREARADRLEEWAAKRETKAAADRADAHRKADMIPFGQPILVGHHSEGRDRNFRSGISAGFDRAHENSSKASDMASRAENIRAQTDQAIYTDDEDAAERLTEKIATLEAKRDEMKARNAAFKKEHKAELKAETNSYLRQQMMPFPSYRLTNLGATIRTAKKRLEQIQREAITGPTDRFITARWNSDCAECGAALSKGDLIRYNRSAGARCADCKEAS
jgi:predicted RNase H-like nuclease (RuvC/YqgF family)